MSFLGKFHGVTCFPLRRLGTVNLRRFATLNYKPKHPINGLSYVIGSTEPPLVNEPFDPFFKRLVSKHGDRQSLVVRHEASDQHAMGRVANPSDCLRWSYRDLDDFSDQLARGLLSFLNPGDTIGVMMGHNSFYPALQIATAKAGIVLAAINPAYRLDELVSMLDLSDCKALVVTPTLKSTNYLETLLEKLPSLRTGRSHNIHEEVLPHLRSIILVDNLTSKSHGVSLKEFNELLKRYPAVTDYRELFIASTPSLENRFKKGDQALQETRHQLTPDHIMNCQFTSGTTGLPKAVPLSHRNQINNGLHIGDEMNLGPDDVLCCPPPLFHCFGLVLGNLAAWTHASSIVYPSESFHPPSILRAIHDEKATACHGVPTHFISLLNTMDAIERGEGPDGIKPGELSTDTLRTGIAAGSPVPDAIMKQMDQRMNLTQQIIAYGQTETAPVSFLTSFADPYEKRTGTVGRVIPHVRAKVVDPEDEEGKPLPVSETGELWTSGYNVFPNGYLKNPEETQKLMRQQIEPFTGEEVNWVRTGDQGVMDGEGYLKITGRIKDLIIRGGENLNPVMIENACMAMEGVAGVAIVAVPDPVYQEVAGAFIERKTTAEGGNVNRDTLRDHLSKRIFPHCVPKPEHIWFIGDDGVCQEFPKTASGKVRKVELRELAIEYVKKRLSVE